MSPLWRGVSGSTQSSRGTARPRRRSDMGAGEVQIPGRRPCFRFRVGSGGDGSKLHGTGGRECPNWCPEEEFDSQVAPDVINSRNALSGAGSDCLRFSHLQSIIRTGIGREKFGAGIGAFWKRIFGDPSAFQPETWQLFLQSNLIALGRKCRPVCVGMTWRHLLAAGTMRQRRPRLEDINREERQFGVGVRGEVEQVALRARVHHEVRNWIIPDRLFQRVQHRKEDGSACRGGHLRAGTHAGHSKKLRKEARPCILPNGFREEAKDRMFQRTAARRHHGPGVILLAAACRCYLC